MRPFIKLLLFSLLLSCTSLVWANETATEVVENDQHAASSTFDAGSMIVHHIQDDHEWHFATIGENHYSIPLPIILYSNTKGLVCFMSSEFHHSIDGSHLGYSLEHGHMVSKNANESVIDFSITKNVASMFVSAFLLVTVFITVANSFQKNRGKAPRGVQSFMEPLIIFIRDDIAKPNIGEKKYLFYLPYLLTAFFFIWINNLLGLFPGGANVTGNIAVTLTLAVLTALITNFSGKSGYWGHIFWTPGVPLPLRIIMIPVEVVGILTKPFALMIRLFANITAGHIIILSIVSFIFIFKNAFVGFVSVPFAIVMNMLEVFVAALQAYIFTLLSALFIGQAVEEHHHEEGHH